MSSQPEVRAQVFDREPNPSSSGFVHSTEVFSGLDFKSVANLLSASADIVLILDAEGIIRDVSIQGEALQREGYRKWVGQAWADTVTVESREKIEQMLAQSAQAGASNDAPNTTPSQAARPRQVNHASVFGPDVPVTYSLCVIDHRGQHSGQRSGHRAAFGRDMRPFSDLQSKLVDAQRAMERDYWQLRYLDTRYRALLQTGFDGVISLDANSLKVLEANPLAEQLLLGASARNPVKLSGRSLVDCFPADRQSTLAQWLAALKVSSTAMLIETGPAYKGGAPLYLNGTYIKQESSASLLICIQSQGNEPKDSKQAVPREEMIALLAGSSDAFVATDASGRIKYSNQAFAELAQLADPSQALELELETCFNRPEVDLNVMLANLRRSSNLRQYSAAIRGRHGSVSQVEISGVAIAGPPPYYGFFMRHVRPERGSRPSQDGELAQKSVDQLTELVGRVPLKDLVRESTDMIEKLCLEAALKLTHNNRASASELLGMSRQSFYSKLNRHGIQD